MSPGNDSNDDEVLPSPGVTKRHGLEETYELTEFGASRIPSERLTRSPNLDAPIPPSRVCRFAILSQRGGGCVIEAFGGALRTNVERKEA